MIEDDEELAEAVAAGLRNARIAVDVALDGVRGLRQARLYEYDVVLLDRDLPGMHGDEVCRARPRRVPKSRADATALQGRAT